ERTQLSAGRTKPCGKHCRTEDNAQSLSTLLECKVVNEGEHASRTNPYEDSCIGIVGTTSVQTGAPTSISQIALSSDTHAAAVERFVGGPLRVLHILNRLDRGGTELVVLKLIRGLNEGLFEHRLAALRGIDPRFESTPFPGGKLLTSGKVTSGFQFPLFRL